MSSSKLRVRLCGIAGAAIVAALLAGCSGSGGCGAGDRRRLNTAGHPGIATPSSVAVVTATQLIHAEKASCVEFRARC